MKHLTGPNEVFLSTLLILFETEKIISVYTLFFFFKQSHSGLELCGRGKDAIECLLSAGFYC